MLNVLDMLFGCWHKNYSFPITAKKTNGTSRVAGAKETYVVCLDCGKEFPYDWNKMKLLSPEPQRAQVARLTVEPIAGFGKVA
jgi:hypothetical protein